jgi:hypothetical protein
LIALLLLVAFGGYTKSWAFSGKDLGIPPRLASAHFAFHTQRGAALRFADIEVL